MEEKDVKAYRLNSLEEPTDEQLAYVMEQVGEDARKSSERAQKELQRRMAALEKQLSE